MKIINVAFCLLATTVLGAAVLPRARADESNKKTVVTFSQAVEVPGKVLPAGTYTFQVMDSPADRHIVQIFNADGSQIVTTVLAVNDYRLQPTGQTVMKFSERAGDSPDALRAWFYPGDTFGQEFVYPKTRAIQLAQTSNMIVPAVAADTLDDSSIKTVTIVAVTPDQKEVDVATAIQTAPATTATTTGPVVQTATPAAATTTEPVVQTSTPVATTTTEPVVQTTAPTPAATSAPAAANKDAEELPQTASTLPLIALFGALSIGLALGLKLILKVAA